MLDWQIDPDPVEDKEYIRERNAYFDDFSFEEEEPTEEELAIASYNYECLCYGEPEKRILYKGGY